MAGTFLNSPLGGTLSQKYESGGLSEIFTIPKSKIISYTPVLDDSGTVIKITAMVLASGVTFQEIVFVEGSASYTDDFKPSNTKRYMDQSITFVVDDSGFAAIEKANQLLLTRKQVYLTKRKNGKYYLLGLSNGLNATAGNSNSGAKNEDDSAMSFTFANANLGYAPEVVMDVEDLEALITRAV